ncbi:MAG: UDP-glucose 4-epimerase [Thaumarchaeota archaeon 13_1_40CM_38_12]|nr:MAG: UDP-glucose 4-epimerase [Thaumarchaeota archaeon 13_1_40CM_38_12]OLD40723.1 MAG: UDP-glucose 4-epimerase [Thaumarchaeota archaeon 13_1_40CM_2_39_4]
MDLTLVTGGAGFIGSHVVDKLIASGAEVKVLDNLSAGSMSNLSSCKDNKRFNFINKDLNDNEGLRKALEDVKIVFHIAADPEVRTGFEHPEISYRENIRHTFYLLEQVRKSNVETILFTSSSTVYGEPDIIPTPEFYGPLIPISPYGASKLACEALISSYCHTYGMKGKIFRLANVIGSRSKHGVILDFIKKLRLSNKRLEVLGDGKQSKSYLHVNDCVDCFFFCLTVNKRKLEIFNVGNEDRIDVISIAKIVCKNMNLGDVDIVTTGGVDNGRGWIGDVKKMHLDISKLKKLGWRPKLSSAEAIKLASKELLKEQLVNIVGN